MADAVTARTLINGQRNLVMKFTNESDGTGESAVLKVDATAAANGVKVQGQTIVPGVHLKIIRVVYDIRSMGLRLLWDADVDQDILVLGGFGTVDFSNVSGLSNPGTTALPGATGSILFTTVNANLGAGYSVTLEMIKGVPQS